MTPHANRGVAWQRAIEFWHDQYARARRARVFPSPPKVKLLSKVSANGRFTGCFEGEGPPDYTGGFVSRHGVRRAVCFDAKDCAGSRWDLSNLERHQARDLDAFHALEHLSFVALRLGEHGGCWVLPWATLGPVYWRWHDGLAARGEASINEDRAAELGWRMPQPGDWMGALP